METAADEGIKLFLEVVDPEVVVELAKRDDGPDRDRFALSALRLGVLALRNARGELDAQTVRQEGERLISQVGKTLTEHATKVTGEVATALKQYLDPATGALQQRLDRLTKSDGDLDGLLARHLDGDKSQLAKTLAEHVGKSSPLFKLLSSDEQGSFLKSLEASVATLLEDQQKKVVAEFSLDNPASALTRLVRELTDVNGKLRDDFVKNVDSVKVQFSLDDPDSALSRLVRQVDAAQKGITAQFSLDDPTSSLSRLQRALEELIEGLAEDQRKFEKEVRTTLAVLQARKDEAARGTRHGGVFEDNVCDVLGAEVRRLGDIGTPCGATVGVIKNCKVGDFIIELGPECAASGERIVVEAKAADGYTLPEARAELETARKNRGAHIGIFVFSRACAPAGMEPFTRYGDDIFAIWDADDPGSDIYLKAAYSVARALIVAKTKEARRVEADFTVIDAALREISKNAESLEEILEATRTVTNANERIAHRARLAKERLLKEIDRLEEHVQALRR